jgi:hypothetical protein
MKSTERETMKRLANENGLTADHFFKSPQGFVIITRQGIERIQQHRGIRVKYEMVHMTDDCKHVVIKAIGEMTSSDGEIITIETYGESAPDNTRQKYPVAMAEKRSLSRICLKLSGFYQHSVYGQDESDDFTANKTK